MLVIHHPSGFNSLKQEWRQTEEGQPAAPVALVPTMGALHDGHLTLIRFAKTLCPRVVVSIFVNPLQFGPHEDFSRYPRTIEDDLAACESLGVDIVFAPSTEEMYGASHSSTTDETTRVVIDSTLTQQLCGLNRPGHFDGVATVVLKLFNIVRPHTAVFGEKDAQQLQVIRQMVSDLNVPVRIVGHPIIREASGLAMSSRNRYLHSSQEQRAALFLTETLQALQEQYQKASSTITKEMATLTAQTLLAQYKKKFPTIKITLEYLEAVNNDTFTPVNSLTKNTRILMAARINGVRLIDNLLLECKAEPGSRSKGLSSTHQQ